MNLRRIAAVFTLACTATLLSATGASAHPLGNFTVNKYDGLVAAPGQLRVDHVEDLAEIPATQAKPDLKRLGTARWAEQRCTSAADGSRLTVDGRTTALTVRTSHAELRPGQAGLNTLRVECRFTAPLPKGATATLTFHSAGADTGPGWREITARGDRMTLTKSDVPKTSVSRELTSYPKDLLSSPADTTTAAVHVRPGGPALGRERQDTPGAEILPRGIDRWTQALTDLVARNHLTVGFAVLALFISIGLGAMHALAPGHGKTLMAATAAARGGRARLRDVLPLAASVTVTHTLGVVALGVLVTAGSAATPSVIAWLGIASGLMVLAAGANLTRRAWRNRAHEQAHAHGHHHHHDHHHHDHEHDSPEKRELALVGAHDHGHHHPHDHDHAHGHDHPHGHDHGAQPHTSARPAFADEAVQAEGGSGGAAPEHGHTSVPHSHGGFTHTHPTAPTLRGTLLLGFAGGLVPSPSAVVVLVGAAALGQAWFGLLLVVAYGVGLALTLTAAGFAVVRLGTGMTRVMDKRPRWTTHPTAVLVHRTIPLVSALVVVALGAGLVLKGAASALL
ncbi:sulfite exporter TauE/SafE family protein [Streptomyces sp. Ag109_O5-10]|uniref:urease accessory protein UreH domain-containing protein n=1 Tax=Streptomyces sp. Ag109_O5-10 TaxID=1855349 RepID=UPI000895BB1A|nr:sulfite exporter TauE/SafE family protein [Streptomyces sp. Ag109_O5-10]SEF13180.1 ABC-type nickel/cobalt efflux system, permease component RcnA [Streptomyces sp. Ag109_O5-10]